jgi:hypothetical protein
MKIIVNDSKNNQFSVDLDLSDSIKTLKDKIKSQKNVKGNIELLFNGMLLEDDDIVIRCGLDNNSIINYIGEFPAGKKDIINSLYYSY